MVDLELTGGIWNISSGLGIPLDPLGGAGNNCWEEGGGLVEPTLPAAS